MVTENEMQIKQNINKMEKSITSVKKKLKRNQNTASLVLASSICLIIGAVMQMVLSDSKSTVFIVVLSLSLCIYVGLIFNFMKKYRKYEQVAKSFITTTSDTVKIQQELLKEEEKWI